MEEKRITIGYDAKRVVNNPTGLGNYGRTLINSLCDDPCLRMRLYSPVEGNPRLIAQLHHRDRLAFCHPEGHPGRIGRDWWRMKSMVSDLQHDGVDLFHGLSGELPMGLKRAGIRSVVTVHDLIFMRHPEWYNPLDVWIYRRKFRLMLREADHIVAISELTRRDVMELGGMDGARISVIYQDCDDAFKHAVPESKRHEVRTRYKLPASYILNVGSIEERKNVLLVLKAMGHMTADTHLVIVGKSTPYARRVEDYACNHGLSDRVLMLHGVPFADLPAIYQEASAFVYPSRYEGFGIPIIEAAHCGLPVVAGTCGCLQEAGGPSGIYVSPDDEESMAKALTQVLAEGKDSERTHEGARYVEQFNSERVAAQMKQLYRNLTSRG